MLCTFVNRSLTDRVLPSISILTHKEDGSHDGYPRYVEQNKYDGTAFDPSSRPGAELIYCHEIGSWVFMHQDILTSPDGKDENECSWLWRSAQTDDYDILSTSEGAWEAWVGKVKPLVQISITSLECSEQSDCNYHGSCLNGMCVCDDLYHGYSCEYELPCPSLASEKAHSLGKFECLLFPFIVYCTQMIEDTFFCFHKTQQEECNGTKRILLMR